MVCPFCNAEDTAVVDSRKNVDGDAIRRRRQCSVCNTRFTTYEKSEIELIVKKRNGNLEEFREHKELVNSALVTAQDLHGRLVASLRNNENEVALTLISAIELNKETEIAFFNSSLKIFNDNYSKILENVGSLP